MLRSSPVRELGTVLLLLGVSLSIQGYRSREGDQAYRLPLLLHHQSASLFASDPFVTALDQFNPHRGFLALLDATSRPAGLSVSLFGLYALTFVLTYLGISRLARAIWPEAPPILGPLAFVLVLVAQAGNIGTNHLFGPMLLDRLLALSLGWNALALLVSRPAPRNVMGATLLLAAAGAIHPSLGLQLTALAIAAMVIWTLMASVAGNRRCETDHAIGSRKPWPLALLAATVIPILLTSIQPVSLFDGLPRDQFRLWSAYVQSPQHLIPSLWRLPQWLAWFCYPALSLLAWQRTRPPNGSTHPSQSRLLVLLALNLAALGAAWIAIEPLADLRITLFQPFRLATVARGLCLVLVARWLLSLWKCNTTTSRLRAALLLVALTNDWSLVVVTLAELSWTVSEVAGFRQVVSTWIGLAVLALGLAFMARHDTASGHILLIAITIGLPSIRWLRHRIARPMPARSTPRVRFAHLTPIAWLVPLAALAAPLWSDRSDSFGAVARGLIAHCRFWETPLTDEEHLALWARAHTPPGVRFVTPPGPKSFRLWSHRAVAFNRAGSPYHAAGLADWAERFRQHVRFEGGAAEFAHAYLHNRQELEARFDSLSDTELAALADRQGAQFVLRKTRPRAAGSRLELLASQGRYAIYRVVPLPAPVQTAEAAQRSAGTG